MKPGKVMLTNFPLRYLVVSVVRSKRNPDNVGRLIVAKVINRIHAKALFLFVSMQPDVVRAELWYLHGKGRSRELELIGTARHEPQFSTPTYALNPLLVGEADTAMGGPLILPERNAPTG